MGSREGLDVPVSYLGTAQEIEALRSACALVDRSWIGRLRMTGDDRLSFLQRYVTQDVIASESRGGTYGFVTNPKGGILADFALICAGDEAWLELPAAAQPSVTEHLGKYALFDRVDIASLEDQCVFAVAGPKAAAWLANVLDEGSVPTENWQTGLGRIAGTEVRLANRPLLGVPAISLWVARDSAPELIKSLEGLTGEQVSEMSPDPPIWAGWDALEAIRIAEGIPRHGPDYGETTLPQETGLEETAISYTKGCYLGQEVVARIHYRGRVNRVVVGLMFEDSAPTSGIDLQMDGRRVGALGSVTSSLGDRSFGLAVVHRKAADIGTVLSSNDGEAQVVDLPLALPRDP